MMVFRFGTIDHFVVLLSTSVSFTMIPSTFGRNVQRARCLVAAGPSRPWTSRTFLISRPPHRFQTTVVTRRHRIDTLPSPAENVGDPPVSKGKGKVWDSAEEAISDIKSGSVVLSAGEVTRLS